MKSEVGGLKIWSLLTSDFRLLTSDFRLPCHGDDAKTPTVTNTMRIVLANEPRAYREVIAAAELLKEEFGVTADELMAHNGYTDPTKLLAGSTIEIPAKADKPKPKPKPQPGPCVCASAPTCG